MLGQLQDAGNTTTLAHYLGLLGGAGILTGLHKYAGGAAGRRNSSPKLQVLNTALMTAPSGLPMSEARSDPEHWGRIVESAVGAHLVNGRMRGGYDVYYWRERDREVDFVVQAGRRLVAIEVKSGIRQASRPGLAAFADNYTVTRSLLVGGDGIEVEEFLSTPPEHWIA